MDDENIQGDSVVVPENKVSEEIAPTSTPETAIDETLYEKGRIGGVTRTSSLFISLGISALVLILVLIFILENPQSVPIRFVGFKGKFPLGITILFSAVGGVLFTSFIGGLRILQLRIKARRGQFWVHR